MLGISKMSVMLVHMYVGRCLQRAEENVKEPIFFFHCGFWVLDSAQQAEFTHCAIFPAPKGLLNGRMKEKHKMLLGNHSKNHGSQIAPERNPQSAIHIRLLKWCLRTPLLLIKKRISLVSEVGTV